MTIRGMILSLTMGLIAIGATSMGAGDARAQGAWPGQAAPVPGLGGPAAPIGGVTARLQQDPCAMEFQPLRDEADRRGELIKAASERHATPDEACKLIGNFIQSEINMIRFVESHATKCGIPEHVADQLRNGHRNTEAMQMKVCAMVRKRGPAGPLGDFDIPTVY